MNASRSRDRGSIGCKKAHLQHVSCPFRVDCLDPGVRDYGGALKGGERSYRWSAREGPECAPTPPPQFRPISRSIVPHVLGQRSGSTPHDAIIAIRSRNTFARSRQACRRRSVCGDVRTHAASWGFRVGHYPPPTTQKIAGRCCATVT
jgi:hypothetical protein